MSDAPDIFAPGMNASAITQRLILGSRPLTLAHLMSLRDKYVVSHILNVCEVDDAPLLRSARFDFQNYRFNPAADDGCGKPAAWFQDSLKFAMPALAEPGWVLYVHCESGMSRSAATVYAILRAWGLSAMRATLLIKEARPEALWLYIASAEAGVAAGW